MVPYCLTWGYFVRYSKNSCLSQSVSDWFSKLMRCFSPPAGELIMVWGWIEGKHTALSLVWFKSVTALLYRLEYNQNFSITIRRLIWWWICTYFSVKSYFMYSRLDFRMFVQSRRNSRSAVISDSTPNLYFVFLVVTRGCQICTHLSGVRGELICMQIVKLLYVFRMQPNCPCVQGQYGEHEIGNSV